MPSAVFLLMALEAARQLQLGSSSTASALMVSDVEFIEPLPLYFIPDSESGREIMVTAATTKSSTCFSFEITSTEPGSVEKLKHHCTGSFGWLETASETRKWKTWDMNHDASLLKQWKSLRNAMPDSLRQLNTCDEGCSGRFEQSIYPHENYPVDPRVLDHIFTLAPLPLTRSNIPATWRLVSVASILASTCARPTDLVDFALDVQPEGHFGARCDLAIRQGATTIFLDGLSYTAMKLLVPTLSPNPLFFKAFSMHDVAYPSNAALHLDLPKLARLISYKWPMSDIKIQNLSTKTMKIILDAFQVHNRDQRPCFRSITILKRDPKPSPYRVRYVEAFDTSEKCHVLFTGPKADAQALHDQLLPRGLLCCPSAKEANNLSLSSQFFETVNIPHDLYLSNWSFWRRRPNTATPTGRKVVLFESPLSKARREQRFVCDFTFDGLHSDLRPISMEPQNILHYCHTAPQTKFDAIVIDDAEKSLITTLPGDVLMPWVQILLKQADSILWVTDSSIAGPFNKVAGTLLRTLQSEKPSLRVLWLEEPDSSSPQFKKCVSEAYAAMLEGDNEIKREIRWSKQAVIRYHPDDELSCATGLISPRKVKSPLTGKNYTLSFAVPKEPIILSSNLEPHIPETEDLEIMAQASVLDPTDVFAFVGDRHSNTFEFSTCRFFAGRILSGNRSDLSTDQVVGFTTELHQKLFRVPQTQVYRRAQRPPSTEAACEFAAIAVASCIVDGVARARDGDVFSIEVDGILKVALYQLFTKAGAKTKDPENASMADFTVTYRVADGIRVNGQRFDLHKYLRSVHGRNFVEQAWSTRRLLSCPLYQFKLPDYGQAFDAASTHAQPYSTAIHHGSDEQIVSHVPTYKPSAALFDGTGHYILVGGLGGLGRFVCTWVVEHGARNLVAISRSGLGSPGVHEIQTAVTALGASLQVFKADACDRFTMNSILDQLRQIAPIKGIVNLAMVLGDAPMASMTGEEWDRALRVKIDSSWILHEETLEDPLEFFILFSSIASVCGNRNQGNYNVGNTFLNALAQYRQSNDRPGISIALGAMSESPLLSSCPVYIFIRCILSILRYFRQVCL